MSDKTILVIDDSATIRKLVDTHLSPAGYRVMLAPTASDGLRLAIEVHPDLILLDHQLPGTTGYEVCCQLAQSPEMRDIPVIVSSTLRNKAYGNYIDLDNVVDMLPKPYSDELLLTTVANALETAAMVVNSQSQGTAIPEVMSPLDDEALTGSFACFGFRELLDFLNNGCKRGILEVEAGRTRIRFHLERGRIQGVDAAGVDPETVDAMVRHLPDSLLNLEPILRMTINGRSFAGVDGFVQLLDQKVLDPRLMTKLLRFQAAMLVRYTVTKPLTSFRFTVHQAPCSLHTHLPLDISLLALLVEGETCAASTNPPTENTTFVRRAIRGQNLDRAGLSVRHMKLLSALAEPHDVQTLAVTLGWEPNEVWQVLNALVAAELIEQRAQLPERPFVVFEPDAEAARNLRISLEASDNRYCGKVVRDKLALQLVLKHTIPHTFVFAGDNESSCKLIRQLFATQNPHVEKIRRIALIGDQHGAADIDWDHKIGFQPDEVILRPCTADQVFQAMDRIAAGEPSPTAAAGPITSIPATPTSGSPLSVMPAAASRNIEHPEAGILS